VAPAAEDLGFHHVLCSRFEVADGLFTGKVTEFCWGEGKVAAAEKLADQLGVDVDQSFAYSDGHEDIPLLDWVGNPRAVNPTAKLTATARRQKWPILRFSSRSRPRTSDLIRSLAATYSIIPSFASGIPVWALTGSKKEALNYSISLFAETASALIGLKLKIEGEHHLWETRPAVFVFNHQSKADVVIMAKLLRRDIASVGKKEIRNLPVIGQILELGGVVMIDRKNSASAIEAMKPLVDAIQEDGKSVCLAPEGTRSATNKLGAFKKGAFHLAMQAGVPVVPVVIHNAADSAPKGTFTFRPATVRVTVLPPVDTSGWKAETIDRHVASVRRMFLKALGQTDEPGRARKAAKGTSKPVAGAKKQTTARKTATSGKTSAGKKAPPKKRTAAATAARPKAKSSGATPSPKKKKSPAGGTKKRTGKRKASGSEAVSSRPQPPAKPQTPGTGDAQNGPGSPANREHDTPTGSESQGA
jgi:putative phosphoserine phosphatase/1-acylglycerol-3-phosphate O-acyltransferase